MMPPEDWNVEIIDGKRVVFEWDEDEHGLRAVCPRCGGRLRWINYDDGDGFVDVAIRCENGDVDTWR